jgi:two-component system, cell cycle response regulator DivK
MNVLIVEDNKPVSIVLSRIIEEAGHGYVIAADGESALRLFAQRDINMAIIDVELPGLDGYQVARDIRNQAPEMPIIIISGNAGESWRQQAMDAGADEFLSKPLRPSELSALLKRLSLAPN